MEAKTNHQHSSDKVQAIHEQIAKDFISKETGFLSGNDGPTDPISIHIFHPPLLLGSWGTLREVVLVEGTLPRADKEVLASFVSKANECVFCAHKHALFAESQGTDAAKLADSLAKNNPSDLSDTRIANISEWSLHSQKVNADLKQKAPFQKELLPEILGTALYFNYMNRVVDTYITRDIFIPNTPGILKFFMKKLPFFKGFMEAQMVKKFGLLGKVTTPGKSQELADHEPPLPKPFAWARGNTSIARALAYFAWSVDDLATTYIPEKVSVFVGEYIRNNYTGEKPPLSRNWAFTAAEVLDGTDEERMAAAFMLLVSFSRFQIDEKLKTDMLAAFPDSRRYRAFGMWAAFQTSKRISEIQSANYREG